MHLIAATVSVCLLIVAGVLSVLLRREHARTAALKIECARVVAEAQQWRSDLSQRTAMDSAKDEFISTVSHELRTPLTSIRGALGLLSAGLMGKVDDRAANLLRIASSNTDRLVRLINDILDLERMDSGNAPIRLRPCSLREIVRQSVDTMGAMAMDAGVHLDVFFGSENGTIIFEGDPDRLQQVLTNLLSNAIKFSARTARVRVEARTSAKEVLICVEDRGRGVPADMLESVFGRFQQVEASDSRQKGGTGLGLAICRSIVHQHGGEIWAERNDSRTPGLPGSTFTVRLPRQHEARPDAEAAPGSHGAVLVVDDDPMIRRAVAENIRQRGYVVVEADSGQSAMEIVRAQPVEAVFLDLGMPGPPSWETISQLKREAATSCIPVVLTRAHHKESVRAQGMAASETGALTGGDLFDSGHLLRELGKALHHGSGPARLLVVEADKDLATMIVAGTQAGAHASTLRIEHASSLNEAVRACETHPPDFLVLDLSLPDQSGFALVGWIRRQPALRHLPIVIYSARELSIDSINQVRAGEAQLLTAARVQPAEITELVSAMFSNLHSPSMELTPGT